MIIMGTADLAAYLRTLPRIMSERDVHAAESARDTERGTLYANTQHAEYGASQH